MRRFGRVVRKAFSGWSRDNSLEWGAALAYYTAFSMAPVLIIALSIVGVFYKGDSLAYLRNQMATLVGVNAATALTGAIRSIHSSEHGTIANIVSIVVLLVGASGAFVQLQNTLNRIWGVQPRPGHFVRDLLKQRLVSFAMVLGISFILLVSLIISSVLAAMTAYFEYLLPGANILWQLLDAAVSFGVVVGLFAAIFRTIPDVHIDWQDVWIGAVVTAALFVAGKMGIGFYLGRSGIGSAYGAAGSLLVLLAWVYYSSQILFFGAEFTKYYAEERRFCVRPIKGVEAVTEGARRREQGLIGHSGHDEKKAA